MHWTQEEEKKRERRRWLVLILAFAGGTSFGIWQGSFSAGLTMASFLSLLLAKELL